MIDLDKQSEGLINFIDELRRNGFNIGMEQYIAATKLAVMIAAKGDLHEHPREFGLLLTPLLCSSPEEQAAFPRYFERWVSSNPDVFATEGIPTQDRIRLARPYEMKRQKQWPQRLRKSIRQSFEPPLVWILILLLGLSVAGLSFWQLTSQQPRGTGQKPDIVTTQAPPQPTLWQRISPSVRWAGAGASLLFLIWLVLIRRRRRSPALELRKGRTKQKLKTEKLVVKGAGGELGELLSLRRTAQELRRPRRFDSTELDINLTIDETIRCGLFTPAYSSRKSSPEYLALIDRASLDDQRSRLVSEIIDRLTVNGVFVDRYYFQGDPRVCRSEGPNARSLTLPDLAAHYPDHCLLVFSDGSELFDPLTGGLRRWIETFSPWDTRFLLSSEIHNGDYREWALREAGFVVSSADGKGIRAVSEIIHGGVQMEASGSSKAQPLPELLRGRPQRWTEDHPPSPEVLQELCRQLQVFLGNEGVYWLTACAVYPKLYWDLTLYLGYKLISKQNFDHEFNTVVRLPWFREGNMPDWLRETLILGLPWAKENAIRDAVEKLLISSLENPDGFVLPIAKEADENETQKSGKRSRMFSRNRAKRTEMILERLYGNNEGSPAKDYVLVDFMAGRKPNRLATPVPSELREILYPTKERVSFTSDQQDDERIQAPTLRDVTEETAVTLARKVIGSRPDDSMVGQEIGFYRIVSYLGEGGIGTVYLAEDLRLNRKVALKFLPSDFISDTWAKRQLIREAQAVAMLDHPNICAVYGFEEIGDHSFIVMQYIEGETLADLIRRDALKSSQIVPLAQQIVSALGDAHAHGIIHRDIKPKNIMVTPSGQVKVLDFGLAKTMPKSLEDATESISQLSRDGLLVGTIAYMSPEQLRGEKLDYRSDIFSLGTVLYEMACGKNPYARETNAEVISAIMQAEAQSLERVAAELPRGLPYIIEKCSRKDRAQRYQSAAEVLIDLENVNKRRNVGRRQRSLITADNVAYYVARGILYALTAACALFAGYLMQAQDFHWKDLLVLAVPALTSVFFFILYARRFHSLEYRSQREREIAERMQTQAVYVFPAFAVLLTLWIVTTQPVSWKTLFAFGIYATMFVYYGLFLARLSPGSLVTRHRLFWSVMLSIGISLYYGLTFSALRVSLKPLIPVVGIMAVFYLSEKFEWRRLSFLRRMLIIAFASTIMTVLMQLVMDRPSFRWGEYYAGLSEYFSTILFCISVSAYLAVFEAWKITSDIAKQDSMSGIVAKDGEISKANQYSIATLAALMLSISALPFYFIFSRYGTWFLIGFVVHAFLSFLFWYLFGKEKYLLTLPWAGIKLFAGVLFLAFLVVVSFVNTQPTSHFISWLATPSGLGILMVPSALMGARLLSDFRRLFRENRRSVALRLFERKVNFIRLLSVMCWVACLAIIILLNSYPAGSTEQYKAELAFNAYSTCILLCLIGHILDSLGLRLNDLF